MLVAPLAKCLARQRSPHTSNRLRGGSHSTGNKRPASHAGAVSAPHGPPFLPPSCGQQL
jgi:hypothetical protein